MYISVQLPFIQKVLVNDFLAAGSGSKDGTIIKPPHKNSKNQD
jgi:hypothetical protein